MGKLRKIKANTAREIIDQSKKALIYFRNKGRQCYLAYNHVSKKYPAYDKKFFYPRLKPYILEEKKEDELIEENWIVENDNYLQTKKKMFKDFYEHCAGDLLLWEATYGIPYEN